LKGRRLFVFAGSRFYCVRLPLGKDPTDSLQNLGLKAFRFSNRLLALPVVALFAFVFFEYWEVLLFVVSLFMIFYNLHNYFRPSPHQVRSKGPSVLRQNQVDVWRQTGAGLMFCAGALAFIGFKMDNQSIELRGKAWKAHQRGDFAEEVKLYKEIAKQYPTHSNINNFV